MPLLVKFPIIRNIAFGHKSKQPSVGHSGGAVIQFASSHNGQPGKHKHVSAGRGYSF